MPRFDRGVVNTKLEKGDIVLMGNPTQYGEILAENILIEDILKADLETLISGSNLVRGKFYRITNAVSSTLSLLVQALTANTICDYAYNTANGDLVTYNISTDLAGVPFSSVYVPYTGATADVNLGANDITANAIIKSGGTSSQFLKADGSVDSNTYITTISGISVGGELSGTLPNPSLVTSAVTGKPLTGLSVSGSAVVSTDSILTGIGKLQNQINAVVGSVNFQGVWNASTNTPTLASGVGTKGYYYVVSVPGSTNLDGITDWKLGDWAIYDGTAWQKVDNTDAVVSVNGYTGIVTLAAADVGALPTSAISGTTGKLPKFTASGTIGDSIISESGTAISLGGTITTNIVGYSLIASSSSVNRLVKIGTGSNSEGSIQATLIDGTAWDLHINPEGGQIITRNATDTGEAHIFGGSARVNGSATIYDASAGLLDIVTTGAALRFINTSGENYIQSGTALSASSAPLKFTSMFGGSTWLSLFTNKLITFGATDTGEAHIFGGSARVNGNVGINASPTSFGGYSTIAVNGSTGGIFETQSAGTSAMLIFSNDVASLIREQRNLPLVFGTNNTERMRIEASGNVGIGTTSPDVFSRGYSGTILGISSSGQSAIELNSATGNSAYFDMGVNGTRVFNISADSTTAALSTVSTQSLVLGTNSINRLTIDGSTGAATFSSSVTAGGQVTSTNVASAFRLLSGSDTLFSIGYIGGTIIDRLATTNFFIAENGSPQLTIASGGAATFNSSVTVSSGGSTNGRLGVRGTTNDSSAYAFEAANSSGSTLFIVRNDGVTSVDGKFLIGTFTPGASKLSVVGLPTSASGLSTGDVWNDSGTLKIV